MPISFRRRRAVSLASSVCLTVLLPAAFVSQSAWAQDTPPPAPVPPTPTPVPNPAPNPPNPTPDNPQSPRPGGGQRRPMTPEMMAQMAAAQGGRGPQAAPANKPRPYSDVITKDAKTDKGLFLSHQIDERYFWEIPVSMLGKEMLWVTTFRQTQTGYGYGGTEVQNRVVRWEKRGDKILLRSVDYQARAHNKEDEPLQKSLALASVEPILLTFDVRAYNTGAGNAPVIEVTPLLAGDVGEFSARRALNAIRADPSRTFIDRVKSLPTNIEMDVLTTYIPAPAGLGGAGGGGGRPGGPPPTGPRPDRSTDAITVVLHHSLVLLPEVPMKARLEDSRVGFFSTGFYDFGNPENRVKEVSYIDRWRLEKKDPSLALSEPVKPIVYYIGPEVPARWRPYLKQAVEDWQPAFEQAGFKNAIVARDVPTQAEDPQFDVDDVRYSVIRWLPSTTENAYGPHVVDPRTGEILNADVKVFENVLKLSEAWYFTQASPNDPRGRKLPLPDDLTGNLLRYVISHEIGHTLGFPHNLKASSSFSIAQLRDPKWTAKWGDEASIMDYGRFNYVAQPGDKARLIPKLGPYDYFAVEWGYKPIDSATPGGEKAQLDKLARKQESDRTLRFGHGPEDPATADDPTAQREDLGDDVLAATTLGLKNIDRVMGYLVQATVKPGENYDLLEEMYGEVFSQRQRELGHVVNTVGGVTQTNYYAGSGKNPAVWTPVPAARQKAAVQFLIAHSFATPTSLLRPDITGRIGIAGVRDRVLQGQRSILAGLMTSTHTKRMADVEAQYRGTLPVYSISDLMDDVRKGIWSELANPQVTINPYRRDLQRAYITAVANKLNPPADTGAAPSPLAALLGQSANVPQPELRPAARAALADTKAAIKNALARTSDRETRQHLLDCEQSLQNALYPKGGG